MRIFAVAIAVAASAGGAQLARGADAPFRADIEKLAEKNGDFRRVLFTGPNLQIVAMSLRAGEEIGEEVHPVDQCFFVVEGKAEGTVDGKRGAMSQDSVLCVPAGARHNIRNPAQEPLKLYTIYAPPQHPPGTVHHTRADAERSEKGK